MGPTLALLARAMAEEARARYVHIVRAGLLLIILVLLAVMQRDFTRMGAVGLEMFGMLTIVNLIFLSLGGIAYVSPAIAEEKEEQTLGLLRMTRLSPLAILLGKGVSRAFGLGVLILLQIPFTMMTITLGGISLNQIMAGYCMLVAYIVLLTGLGLFCSTLMNRTSTATTVTGIALAAFMLGPNLGREILREILPYGGFRTLITDFLEAFNHLTPIGRCEQLFGSGFSGSSFNNIQVWSNVSIGIAFFLASWALFDRLTRQAKESSEPRGLALRMKRVRIFNPSPIWSNALAWKDYYFIIGGRLAMIVRGVLYLLVVAGIVAVWEWDNATTSSSIWSNLDDIAGASLAFFSFIFAIEAALVASRIFRSELKANAWSTLAMLPRTTGSIVRGKLLGSLRGLVLIFLVWGCSLAAVFYLMNSHGDEVIRGTVGIFAEGILFLHIVTLTSLYAKYGAIPIALMFHIFALGILPAMLRIESFTAIGWAVDTRAYFTVGLASRIAMIVLAEVLIMGRLRRLAAE